MSSPYRYSHSFQSVNDFYRRYEAKEPVGPPSLRADMRVVKACFPYAPWMDAVIHFGKNKGMRLGELRMCQAWWYLEKFDPKPFGHAALPCDEDFALRFALNGMLRAIASCPKEAMGAETRRAKSGYKTARDILRQRGLPLPEQAVPAANCASGPLAARPSASETNNNNNTNEEHTS